MTRRQAVRRHNNVRNLTLLAVGNKTASFRSGLHSRNISGQLSKRRHRLSRGDAKAAEIIVRRRNAGRDVAFDQAGGDLGSSIEKKLITFVALCCSTS